MTGHRWSTPITTRSRVVLEIASELVGPRDFPFGQAKVLLRPQGPGEWKMALFGSSTIAGAEEVVRGEAALAIVNPVSAVALAVRGKGIFKEKMPIAAIGVIPSFDQYAFAVSKRHGLTRFEEIAEKQPPLKLSLRGQSDHWLHPMLDDICAAAGFSLADIERWGGVVRREGLLPYPDGPKFAALRCREIDALFDEAANVWVEAAAQSGMTLLPLAESTVAKLEAMGYRRNLLTRGEFPSLTRDLLTMDFSGWPIVVHREAEDDLVTSFCAALDARKANIPWQGEGPLPVERLCRDAPDTPQDVPIHPAAEKFWRDKGYLS
jgi:hypothetical protein